MFPPSNVSFIFSGASDLSAAPAFAADGETPWNRANARAKLSGEDQPYFSATSMTFAPSD